MQGGAAAGCVCGGAACRGGPASRSRADFQQVNAHTFHSATSPFLSPETSSSRPPAASVRTLWWWHSSGLAAGSSSCGSQRRTSCGRGSGQGAGRGWVPGGLQQLSTAQQLWLC